MVLTLKDLQRLICHKTQTKQCCGLDCLDSSNLQFSQFLFQGFGDCSKGTDLLIIIISSSSVIILLVDGFSLEFE